MIRRFVTLIVTGRALSGCALLSVRDDAPAWSAIAHRNLNDTSACVVRVLDKKFHSNVPLLAHSITHQIQVIEPGRVFEVVPQQTITIGAEIYIVKLTARSAAETQMSLQAGITTRGELREAVQECA